MKLQRATTKTTTKFTSTLLGAASNKARSLKHWTKLTKQKANQKTILTACTSRVDASSSYKSSRRLKSAFKQ